MPGLALVLLGLAAAAGAIATLRTYGPRFRIGRLLAAAPEVSVAEALELARSARPAFVRVTGRIDSEAEFEDADHRPLVFRRTRFQVRRGRSWKDFDSIRETVPFVVREGLEELAVDVDALDQGLVVIPRESSGIVGDLGDRAPKEIDDGLPARVVVDQVSSIEHASIVGVPTIGPDGTPRIGPGLGRPLILTTLDQPEAMRILAGGSSLRPRVAAALLVAAIALLAAGVVLSLLPGIVLAATPEPSAATGYDTRSSGQGPGLVGAPLAAIGGVVGIGLAATLLTLAFVRATGEPRREDRDR